MERYLKSFHGERHVEENRLDCDQDIDIERRGIVGAIVATIISGGVPFLSGCSIPTTESPWNLEREKTIDLVIAKAEMGMAKLFALLQSGLPEEDLRVPFRLIEFNKNNQFRNAVRAINQAKDKASIVISDRRFFIYDVDENLLSKHGAIASFVPPERRMILWNGFDAGNFFDVLVLCHEVCHVLQDVNNRQRMSQQEYDDLYDPAKHIGGVPFDHELQAYSIQMELLNILCNDAFKKGEKISLDKLQRILHASKTDVHILQGLINYATAYWPEGRAKDGHLSLRFINYLAGVLSAGGKKKLFVMHGNQYVPYVP